jgi:hypothetical protein
MKTQIIYLFFATILMLASIMLNGCSKDESQEFYGPLLTNGNVESGSSTPDGWNYATSEQGFNFNWTSLESFSPSHSLGISTSVSHANIAAWIQTISKNLPCGHRVVLKAKIKCNLTGDGVAVVMRGDDTVTPSGSAEEFASTQTMFTINGTSDWKDWYIATSSNLSNTIKSITAYLIYLPNTTGEVYFDDIELKATYK